LTANQRNAALNLDLSLSLESRHICWPKQAQLDNLDLGASNDAVIESMAMAF
jgi:hypothetical protein